MLWGKAKKVVFRHVSLVTAAFVILEYDIDYARCNRYFNRFVRAYSFYMTCFYSQYVKGLSSKCLRHPVYYKVIVLIIVHSIFGYLFIYQIAIFKQRMYPFFKYCLLYLVFLTYCYNRFSVYEMFTDHTGFFFRCIYYCHFVSPVNMELEPYRYFQKLIKYVEQIVFPKVYQMETQCFDYGYPRGDRS